MEFNSGQETAEAAVHERYCNAVGSGSVKSSGSSKKDCSDIQT